MNQLNQLITKQLNAQTHRLQTQSTEQRMNQLQSAFEHTKTDRHADMIDRLGRPNCSESIAVETDHPDEKCRQKIRQTSRQTGRHDRQPSIRAAQTACKNSVTSLPASLQISAFCRITILDEEAAKGERLEREV